MTSRVRSALGSLCTSGVIAILPFFCCSIPLHAQAKPTTSSTEIPTVADGFFAKAQSVILGHAPLSAALEDRGPTSARLVVEVYPTVSAGEESKRPPAATLRISFDGKQQNIPLVSSARALRQKTASGVNVADSYYADIDPGILREWAGASRVKLTALSYTVALVGHQRVLSAFLTSVTAAVAGTAPSSAVPAAANVSTSTLGPPPTTPPASSSAAAPPLPSRGGNGSRLDDEADLPPLRTAIRPTTWIAQASSLTGACTGMPMFRMHDRPVMLLFVNGISVDQKAFDSNLSAIRYRAGCQAGVDGIQGFFTPKAGLRRDLGTVVAELKTRCVADVECGRRTTDSLLVWFADTTETVTAVRLQGTALSGVIEQWLQRGFRVILIPHSRGSLTTQVALSRPQTRRPQAVADKLVASFRSCVRVVAVAPVEMSGWPEPANVRGLYSADGIARDLLLSRFVRRSIPPEFRSQFSVVRNPGMLDEFGYSLHSFESSYLAGANTREWIERLIANATSELRDSPCAPADSVLALAEQAMDALRKADSLKNAEAVQAFEDLKTTHPATPIPVTNAAGQTVLDGLRGTWAETTQRPFWSLVLRFGAGGTGQLGYVGNLIAPSVAQPIIVRKNGVDSLYFARKFFADEPERIMWRGTVTRLESNALRVRFEMDTAQSCRRRLPTQIPGSLNKGGVLYTTLRPGWAKQPDIVLERVSESMFQELIAEHRRIGGMAVALGGGGC